MVRLRPTAAVASDQQWSVGRSGWISCCSLGQA